MKILNGVVQGSDAWHEARKGKRTASEAAAVFGDHKYITRNDLLKQKATGLVPEVGDHQQRIFDAGHQFEGMARPIAEEIIGEELYPCTCVDDTDTYLASMDGLDMVGTVGFEHKSLNDKLRTATAETLEDHYKWQMDHQMMVTGAEKILFMASNGTKDDCNWFWYERDEKRIERLIAAWEQFAKDLADYEAPEAEQPKAEGKAPDALPALSVQVQGMVTASNLKAFEESARATLAKINTDLQTDEDFSTAEKTVKFCKDVEGRLDAAKENVLGQMQTVDEVVRSIDAIKEETRQIRLKLNKAVTEQKESRKAEILKAANEALQNHLCKLENSLEQESGGLRVPVSYQVKGDFAGAMKGKKTISSLKSACDDELARAKIQANEAADLIRANILQLKENAFDYKFLFNDFGQICMKPADDFAAIVKMRIAEHKEAEQKRMDAEREKIRQEEEAKAKSAQAKSELQPEHAAPASGQGRENQASAEVPRNTQELMREHKPSASEIITVLCKHYGADRQTVIGWLANAEIQEAA